MSACRPRPRRKHLESLGAGKEEAPSMYEMEGASQSHVPNGPIARPANPRNTPPSVGKASANPGRLGARLPERRLPRAARQLGNPAANSGLRSPALANSQPWCSLLALRFPSEPGHRLWWRERFVVLPEGLRKRLEEPISRFCEMARIIHRTGCVIPRLRRVVHRLSTGSSTRASAGTASQPAPCPATCHIADSAPCGPPTTRLHSNGNRSDPSAARHGRQRVAAVGQDPLAGGGVEPVAQRRAVDLDGDELVDRTDT